MVGFTLDFLFKENKRKTVREIRPEYVHRGQTYLTASHSQLPYFRRDGDKQWLACRRPPPPSSLASGLVSSITLFPLPFERLPRRLARYLTTD